MKHKPFQAFLLCAIALLMFSISERTNAQQSSEASHLRQQQREALQKWLARHSAFRLATEADCENKEGLKGTREEYGSGYHPYYAVGDFNHDDNDDFAVVLIDKIKSKDKYAVIIFNGTAKGGYGSGPVYFEGGYDLRNGGLFYFGYGRGDRLAAGVFMSDVCIGLRARGKGYVMSPCGY
jgi:hypothetical protein